MEDKRQYLRMQSDPLPCSVNVDQVRTSGMIVNESISGARIVGLDLLMMPFNKELTLEYHREKISVHARNTSRDADNKFVLGVVRSEMLELERRAASSAMLINCYVKHGDACVICMPIHIESESLVVIQLWDGVQFRVPRQTLLPMSREERFAMLSEPQCLEYTASMYGFEAGAPEWNLQNLFEYEFGTHEGCPVAENALAVATN